jgi:hypothetical protein
MGAKKNREIVMHRNKRQGRTAVILKNILLVTALLAIIEVVILVVLHNNKAKKATAKISEKPKQRSPQTIAEVKKDTTTNIPATPLQVIVTTPPKDTIAKNVAPLIAKKDTPQIIKPVVEKLKIAKRKPLKDSAILPVAKPAEIKKASAVSDEQMAEILNDVRTQKNESNKPVNCISIQIIDDSNAENGNKIAGYLRKNGYIISGREVVKGTQKGVKMMSNGPCMKLAIGTL